MRASTLKGFIHAALAIAALLEYKASKTKLRTLLLGAAAGWHSQATVFHWCFDDRPHGQN
jgi:hypothetical protein